MEFEKRFRQCDSLASLAGLEQQKRWIRSGHVALYALIVTPILHFEKLEISPRS